MSEPILLKSESVEFAKSCLMRHGTNDLMPRGVFIQSIKSNWHAVKSHLLSLDCSNYPARKPQVMFSPKTSNSFRVSHSLEILDYLVLTAIIHQHADQIEKWRSPRNAGRVFSNRVRISDDSLFETGTYSKFQQECKRLASDEATKYVVSMDIVDCYNQISVHRVANSLQEASISQAESEAIERILTKMNGYSSRGLPVGQEFSSLLSEACLEGIDDIIAKRGYTFLRFVDDYRVFCESYKRATEVVHSMATVLNDDIHKLCLNESKTRIYKADTFLQLESVDPEMREKSERYIRYRRKVSFVLDLIKELWDEPYDSPPTAEEELSEDFTKGLQSEAHQESIVILFETALEEFDFQLLKHLLNTARLKRLNILLGTVISNLSLLAPVYAHVCRYLAATESSLLLSQQEQLSDFLHNSFFGDLEFIREWTLDMLFHRQRILTGAQLASLLNKWSENDSRYRFALASFEGSITSVREDRSRWAQLPREARNWFIYASRNLPSGERSALWKQIVDTGDLLDQSMIVWLRGSIKPSSPEVKMT